MGGGEGPGAWRAYSKLLELPQIAAGTAPLRIILATAPYNTFYSEKSELAAAGAAMWVAPAAAITKPDAMLQPNDVIYKERPNMTETSKPSRRLIYALDKN